MTAFAKPTAPWHQYFISSVFKHAFPFLFLIIDFSLNAMRFEGWNTWLNYTLSLWFLLFYVMVNYSYVIKFQEYLYAFMLWHTSLFSTILVTVGFCGLTVPLWVMFWAFSSLKDPYFAAQEAQEARKAAELKSCDDEKTTFDWLNPQIP